MEVGESVKKLSHLPFLLHSVTSAKMPSEIYPVRSPLVDARSSLALSIVPGSRLTLRDGPVFSSLQVKIFPVRKFRHAEKPRIGKKHLSSSEAISS